MWRIMAIVYELLQQKKTMTQREIYYYLAKEFRNQQVALDSQLAHAAVASLSAFSAASIFLAILIGVGIGAVALLSLIFIKWVFIFLALGVVVLGVVEFSRALAGSDRRIDLAPQIVARPLEH